MQRSTVEGQLNVERSGSGSETLLLIHGFADNLATWHKVVPHLETRYRVLAVDLPGFGQAAAVWPRPLIAGYVALLAELIESEGSRRVTVIGNSLGAATALALATAHPHLVDRVVLCDMPGIDTLPRTWKLLGTKPTELLLRALATPIPAPILQQAIGITYAYGAMRHPLQPGFSTVRSSFDMHYADKSRVLGLLPLARQVFIELAEMPIRRMVRRTRGPGDAAVGSVGPAYTVPESAVVRRRADPSGCCHTGLRALSTARSTSGVPRRRPPVPDAEIPARELIPRSLTRPVGSLDEIRRRLPRSARADQAFRIGGRRQQPDLCRTAGIDHRLSRP